MHLRFMQSGVGRHRTPNQREANQQKGRDYAEAVRRLMDAEGYVLTDSADASGTFVDLEFTPKVSGRPVIAEAKNVSLDSRGLSPNDYKKGIAEYFLEWLKRNEEYQFRMFVSNESNPGLWKRLFRGEPDEDTVQEFFDKLQALKGEVGEQLSRYDDETFYEFAADTSVWNYNYVELHREADRAERTGDYDYEPYLTAYPAIDVDQRGEVRPNLFEVTGAPQTVFKMEIEEDVQSDSFYDHPSIRHAPMELDGGNLYSLLSADDMPDEAAQIVTGGVEQQSFGEWLASSDDDRIDLVKALFRGLVLLVTKEAGAMVGERRDGRRRFVYIPLGDAENRDVKKIDGRWMAKKMDNNLVRHRALEVNVKRFAGRYYYAFTPIHEFTTDGEKLVPSDLKSDLTSSFSPGKFPEQNARQRKTMETWAEKLNPGGSMLAFGDRPKAVRELQFRQVGGFTIDCRPPMDGDERNEWIEER